MAQAEWYVIHTYSGYENNVASNLEKLIDKKEFADRILEVRIPTMTETEVKDNKTKEYERKLFPGYVFVKLVLDDNIWYVIRNTRGVTGFVGTANKPIPLTPAEVANLGVEVKTVTIDYVVGDSVKVNEGPLEGFIGIVESIDSEHQKVKVKVSMFGKETLAELDFSGVALV